MEQAARVAGIADAFQDDLEAARDTPASPQSPSRKSTTQTERVPIPRRSLSTIGGRRTPAASIRSRANSTALQPPLSTTAPEDIGQAVTTDADAEPELPWNPLHACWPHPNPHVPLSSPLYASTRIIRLQRDYRTSGDLYPAFEVLYPEILEGCLSQEEFRGLVGPLNERLREMFDPFGKRRWVDAVLGAATGWLWEDFGLTGMKKGITELEAWCEGWNEKVGRPRGVEMIPLRRTAFLTLDLQVPDPTSWVFMEEEEEEEEGADGNLGTSGAATEEMRTSTMGSQSLRTSSSYSRVGGARSRGPEPNVPPIPREYLEEERM